MRHPAQHLDSLSGKSTSRVPLQIDRPGTRSEIPEPIARLAYEQYAYLHGTSQSFERLHQRGGFGHLEALALLADLVERERATP